MTYERTYEMEPDAPPAEAWEDYERRATTLWRELLSSPDLHEDRYQAFLEDNPAFVPGAHGLSLTSGHVPIRAGVFAKPVLPGYSAKQPDMMWIATDSVEITPILLEIERPSKKWLTADGVPRREFTQARNQLTDWREWFAKPHNQLLFREGFHLDRPPESSKPLRPFYVLVYGRRDDIKDAAYKRAADRRPDEEVMTFDRFSPSRDQADYLCIRLRQGHVSVVTFPSTGRIGPNIAPEWVGIGGFEQAIERSSAISLQRKAFLRRRIPYWLQWAQERRGIIFTGDWE